MDNAEVQRLAQTRYESISPHAVKVPWDHLMQSQQRAWIRSVHEQNRRGADKRIQVAIRIAAAMASNPSFDMDGDHLGAFALAVADKILE